MDPLFSDSCFFENFKSIHIKQVYNLLVYVFIRGQKIYIFDMELGVFCLF